MSNPVWPQTLPAPLQGSANYASIDNTVRTTVDGGVPKMRRRFTAVIQPFTCEVLLDAAQVAELREFVDTTLSDVGVFDWTDFRTGATQSYRFTQRPTYAHVDGLVDCWRASLKLEALP